MKRLTLFFLYFSSVVCFGFAQQKTSGSRERDTSHSHSDTIPKKPRITKVVLSVPSKTWQRQVAIEGLQKYIGTSIEYCIFYYGGKVDKNTGITYLYFGGTHPEQILTVKITKKDRMKFKYHPITEFSNKELCINGLLLNNHGSMEIMVHDPKQLKVVYT